MKPNLYTFNEVKEKLTEMGYDFTSKFDPHFPIMRFDVYKPIIDEQTLIDFITDFAHNHEMRVGAYTEPDYWAVIFESE